MFSVISRKFSKEEKMTKKYLEKCSPSLAIKEVKIETSFKIHLIMDRMAKFNKHLTTHAGEGVGKRVPSFLLVVLQIDSTTIKISIKIHQPHPHASKKLKNQSTIWSSSTTPCHMPQGLDILVHRHLLDHTHFCFIHNS